MPYLLSIQQRLYKSTITEDFLVTASQRLPQSECFSFCLSSLLSQIALLDPSRCNEIVTALLESARNILLHIEDACQQLYERTNFLATLMRQTRSRHASPAGTDSSKAATHLASVERVCMYLAPALAGLLRGMGRGLRSTPRTQNSFRLVSDDTETPASIVTCLLPPCPKRYVSSSPWNSPGSVGAATVSTSCSAFGQRLGDQEFALSVFPQFQSVIPHSLCHSLMLANKEDPTERSYSKCNEFVHKHAWCHYTSRYG
ncbi:hypothetical protein FBUS_11583 [Fasciolopsis buskii]|uniref:Uncharacterized protein n=1 Tax=Fasciolopsis buskii TaxID=27845 RepID=A0A8E0RYY8_9TREM|nr:hypothetical protein FBUS_11583 [Fasciolopsis buski]